MFCRGAAPSNPCMGPLRLDICVGPEVTVYQHTICMADFGGLTLKPTILYSNKPWISEIDSFKHGRPPKLQREKTYTLEIDERGNKKVYGGPGLKQTQRYPAKFGIALAKLWRKRSDVGKAVDASGFT